MECIYEYLPIRSLPKRASARHFKNSLWWKGISKLFVRAIFTRATAILCSASLDKSHGRPLESTLYRRWQWWRKLLKYLFVSESKVSRRMHRYRNDVSIAKGLSYIKNKTYNEVFILLWADVQFFPVGCNVFYLSRSCWILNFFLFQTIRAYWYCEFKRQLIWMVFQPGFVFGTVIMKILKR